MNETTVTTTDSTATAPEPITTEAPAPLIGNDMNFREDWRESLSEDLRSEPYFQRFNNLNDLAKSGLSGQKMIGLENLNVAPIPDETSPENVWNEFYQRIGRPDTSDSYEFADAPEGMEINKESLSQYRDFVHGLGLTQKQAAGIYDFHNSMEVSAAKTKADNEERQFEEDVAALKEEWGYAFDQKLEIANRAVRTFDKDGILKKMGLDNSPWMVRVMAGIGSKISEDTLVKGPQETVMTPNDAMTKINAIMGDPRHPYNVYDHASHGDAVRDVNELYKLANPGEPEVAETLSFGNPRARLMNV